MCGWGGNGWMWNGGYGGGWGWGGWIVTAVVLVVFFALLITAVVLAVRYLGGGGGHRGSGQARAVEDVLAERFARGEIDDEEFRKRVTLLREHR